jgi:hypothetical protein
MIGMQCALNPYFLGTQLEGIAGEFQGLRRMFVSGMINGHVLVFRYPFHNIRNPLRRLLGSSCSTWFGGHQACGNFVSSAKCGSNSHEYCRTTDSSASPHRNTLPAPPPA